MVLLIRAFGKEQHFLEERLRAFRTRIGENTVPVLEAFASIASAILLLIYGRTIRRRMAVSMVMAMIFVGMIAAFAHHEISRDERTLRAQKHSLERAVDPELFDYATRPEHRETWKRAFETEKKFVGYSSVERGILVPQYEDVPKYPEPPYSTIRKARSVFARNWVSALETHPNHQAIATLFFLEGNYLEPGARVVDLLTPFAFAAVVDFLAITAVLFFIELLKRPSWKVRLLAISGLVVTSGLAIVASVFSTSMVFFGHPRVFTEFLLVVPMSIVGIVMAVALFIYVIVAILDKDWEAMTALPVMGSMTALLCYGVYLYVPPPMWMAPAWKLSFASAKDFAPVLISSSALAPLVVVLIAAVVAVVLKLLAEPVRLVTWGYMTLVELHQSGTHLFGIIVLMSLVSGAALAVLRAHY
jgi:hypothetical protein